MAMGWALCGGWEATELHLTMKERGNEDEVGATAIVVMHMMVLIVPALMGLFSVISFLFVSFRYRVNKKWEERQSRMAANKPAAVKPVEDEDEDDDDEEEEEEDEGRKASRKAKAKKKQELLAPGPKAAHLNLVKKKPKKRTGQRRDWINDDDDIDSAADSWSSWSSWEGDEEDEEGEKQKKHDPRMLE